MLGIGLDLKAKIFRTRLATKLYRPVGLTVGLTVQCRLAPEGMPENRRTPQDALVTTAGHPNYTQMTNMNVSQNF